MNVEDELSELVAVLATVGERIDSLEDLEDGASGANDVLSGESPDAQENRAIRGAAATLARERARAVRADLADVRDRARRLADRNRARPGRNGDGDHRTAAPAPDAERDRFLGPAVRAALEIVPGARWAAVCVDVGHGPVTTHGASDARVERLARIQVEDGEGPALEALGGAAVHVPDVGAERRWPRFTAAAGEAGVGSVLALGVSAARWRGALVLYSPHPGGLDGADAVAGRVTDLVGVNLACANRVEGLQRALESRDVIGQAKGMLMLRHRIDADRAFTLLIEASQHANVKLVDVARAVVADPGLLAER